MPKLSEVFRMANDTITHKDLIPVEEFKKDEKRVEYTNKYGRDITEYTAIKNVADYIGVSEKDVYWVGKGLINLCYFKNGVYAEIPSIEEDFLNAIRIKETIQYKHELIAEGKFKNLLALTCEGALFLVFQSIFDSIPDEDKYKEFIGIYTRSEYGFKELDKNFVREICSYKQKDEEVINRLKGFADIDNAGYFTVYRGEGSLSNSVEDAYSWTTDIGVAVYFATRFDISGNVYKAKIHMDDALDFIMHRGEKEVLLLPEKLLDIEKLELFKIEDIMDDLTDTGFVKIYGYHANVQLKKEWFFNPHGIHGILHAKRVLLLSLVISYYNDISYEDTEILIKASLYHDIGRSNDGKDEIHGYESYNKAVELGLLEKAAAEDENILKFIIDNHCIDDNKAIMNINDYGIDNIERAIYLYKIFKDADCLDRVRLNIMEFDTRYLRLDISRKMVLLAKQLLVGIR